jgi:hypothetical protein
LSASSRSFCTDRKITFDNKKYNLKFYMSSDGGFDISAVIGLQRVLPSRPSSTTTTTTTTTTTADSDAITRPPHDPRVPRRLGDFSRLWEFLSTVNSEESGASASTPPTSPEPANDKTTVCTSPEVSALRSEGSPKKPRRNVTFSPTVEVGRDNDNDNNNATTTTTTTTALNDNGDSEGVKAFVKHVSRPVIKSSVSAEDRKINIITKLLGMFPEARASLLSPASAGTLSPEGIHVFIDNSNVCFPLCEGGEGWTFC